MFVIYSYSFFDNGTSNSHQKLIDRIWQTVEYLYN